MDTYIINTPYHLMIASASITNNDLIIVIDDFDYRNSKFCNTLINEYLMENQVLILKGLRSFRGNPIKLIRYIKETILKDTKNSFTSQVNNIILFNDGYPLNQLLVSIIQNYGDVLLIEEGIGLYRNVKKRFHFMYDIIGKIIFGKQFENTKRLGEYTKTTKIKCNYPTLLTNLQLSKKVDLIGSFNFESLKHIEKTLLIEDSFNNESGLGINLFIGQPLVEDGVVDEKKYISIIIRLIKRIEDNGVQFIIKPHPRENLNKYKFLENNRNVTIINNKDIPIEMFIYNKKNIKVFTAYSSAIFNIARYFKIQTYLIYKLYNLDPEIPNEMLNSPNISIVNNFNMITRLKENSTDDY